MGKTMNKKSLQDPLGIMHSPRDQGEGLNGACLSFRKAKNSIYLWKEIEKGV